MTSLHQLKKTTIRRQKRLGRGYGSGKGGHTVGRGAKGMKARSKVGLTFEGSKAGKSLIQRLPLRRGKGKFKSLRPGPVIVNVRFLNLFSQNALVDLKTIMKKGLVDKKEAQAWGVKILGDGELKKSLRVALPCSAGAMKKIKKAGGQVVKK